MLTALSPLAYKHVQTNAGVFVLGIDPGNYEDLATFKTALNEALQDRESCLGATRGGGGFSLTRDSRVIEADGRRFGFVGDRVVDNMDPMLNTTLIEIIPENLKRGIGAADIETEEWYKKIQPRTNFTDEDYIPVLTWVGDTNQGFLAITLYNALNTADLNYTFTDKGEGTLPVEFHAHQSNLEDYDTPPFAIYSIDDAASVSNA